MSINTSPFVKIGNGYYYISLQAANWFMAYESCRKLRSELVTFENSEEHDAIQTYLQKKGSEGHNLMYWTSGNDLGKNGVHNWFSSAQPITINRWAPGQPDNYQNKEHCDFLSSEYQYLLSDGRCECYKRYICEAPKQETISIVVWK